METPAVEVPSVETPAVEASAAVEAPDGEVEAAVEASVEVEAPADPEVEIGVEVESKSTCLFSMLTFFVWHFSSLPYRNFFLQVLIAKT